MDDATAIAARVRSGEISAVEVTRDHLDQIAERDRGIDAVWWITEQRALEEALGVDDTIARGENPGPLAGVPVGVKDLIDTGGSRTTYGSAIWRDHIPDRDADAVTRLATAGAVTIAKLATHELAWGTTNDNPWFGTCRNPHDSSRVPGGSSGGSAAAVAVGTVALALGTDTGGSIRCPASCCGIVGFKPTFGRVSLAGIHPLCPTLDHCGPMARSVRDCALALELLAGASPRDPRTPPVAVERYRDALERGVSGMTVGVAERYFFEHTQADIASRVRAAVDVLRDAGAEVTEVDLGWPAPGEADFYLSEEGAALGDHWPSRRADLGADVVRELDAATRLTGIDTGRARQRRIEYQAQTEERLRSDGVDVIVTPTLALSPPLRGATTASFAGNPNEDVTTAMLGMTGVFNVLGWPAISVPFGTDTVGLPVGIQIAALPWREADCLAAAAVLAI